MSAEILERIKETCGPNGLGLQQEAEEQPRITDEDDGLPSPATPKDVAHIALLYEENKAHMENAKAKLQTPPLPTDVDWELSLYMLFCAWIVNFGREGNAQEDPEEASKLKQEIIGDAYPKQLQHLIKDAAHVIGLTWIPFVDLALAPFSEANPASGPFGGVFVSHGPKPFMILAFKGTTFSMEWTTDNMDAAVRFRPLEDVLYGERAHHGKGQGLFIPFTYVGEKRDAFEIIWERLHAEAHKLQISRGDVGEKIPLYVTGHSLGSGYATLTYIELIRRIGLAEPTSFALYDAWAFGADRVILNAGAKKVKTVLQDSMRHFYRPAREGDVAATRPHPPIIGNPIYKHLDIGYNLNPEDPDGKYVTVRPSEIDKPPVNDDPSSSKFHPPPMYYKGIKKVLDTQQ
jgi:hypothetical protein